MPRLDVSRMTPLQLDLCGVQVARAFHLPLEPHVQQAVCGELPDLSEDWRLGAIVGPSGSGKTTLAEAAYGALPHPSLPPWPSGRALIDVLGDCGPDWPLRELTRLLTAVGLGSVPLWLRPYAVLSTGQRQRAELARLLVAAGPWEQDVSRTCPPLVVVDEFTSGLDRRVASTLSAALVRWLRRQQPPRQVVVVSCHEDILPWLEPDWVLRCRPEEPGVLTRGRLRRPAVRLRVARVSRRWWPVFARHHYLTGSLPAAAACYVAWWPGDEGPQPAALCAVTGSPGHRGVRRIARLVTLPEFQGLGIASQLADLVAGHYAAQGRRVTLTTGHPAMVSHLLGSVRWRLVQMRRRGNSPQTWGGRPIRSSTGRPVACFAFVGQRAR